MLRCPLRIPEHLQEATSVQLKSKGLAGLQDGCGLRYLLTPSLSASSHVKGADENYSSVWLGTVNETVIGLRVELSWRAYAIPTLQSVKMKLTELPSVGMPGTQGNGAAVCLEALADTSPLTGSPAPPCDVSPTIGPVLWKKLRNCRMEEGVDSRLG